MCHHNGSSLKSAPLSVPPVSPLSAAIVNSEILTNNQTFFVAPCWRWRPGQPRPRVPLAVNCNGYVPMFHVWTRSQESWIRGQPAPQSSHGTSELWCISLLSLLSYYKLTKECSGCQWLVAPSPGWCRHRSPPLPRLTPGHTRHRPGQPTFLQQLMTGATGE